MKYLFFVYFVLASGVAKSQVYNRETNNNKVYNDSTAKVEINELYELIKHGQNFSDVATKYSQDPGSYKVGGQLKPSTMEEYVEEYKNVVLKLPLNQISKPFRTDYGYHIVQLISKKDSIYSTRHILLRVD